MLVPTLVPTLRLARANVANPALSLCCFAPSDEPTTPKANANGTSVSEACRTEAIAKEH
ncbi:hypothetical protein H6F96_06970 [Microcoleus sp. FACHB-53]|nr:hypothetical protein [Microcoleus sp. FACHB-53]MBD2128795.1 hypothetical protein [Microcoleus sp. FACHB-1]